MIEAVGYRVLVTYDSLLEQDPLFKRVRELGIEIPEDHPEFQRRSAGLDKGTIVAVGPQAEYCKDLKPGDRVYFAKHSGKMVVDETDQKKYLVLNDEDILTRQRA